MKKKLKFFLKKSRKKKRKKNLKTKILTSIEDFDRIPVIGPALELPLRPHGKHGHNAVPLLMGQLAGVVCDAVGHRQPACRKTKFKKLVSMTLCQYNNAYLF